MIDTSQQTMLSITDNLKRNRAWIEIDRMAIANNVKEIRKKLTPHTALMAVVKADAYGHGAVTVAQTALEAGASWLATATLEEGIELREAGITVPILILGAINTAEEFQAIAHCKLHPTICNVSQASICSEALSTLDENLPIHLKLDTGMSRLGTAWDKAAEFIDFTRKLPNIKIDGVYSHLATADDPEPTMLNLQQQRFKTIVTQSQLMLQSTPVFHLANSAATLTHSSLHYDLVRVGLALYGLFPAPHFKTAARLKPVLQVRARITQVKTLPPHTGVSYGHQFHSDKAMRVAVAGIGYADGVPRNLSNHLNVLLRGEFIRQVGAITMDQMMLDVSRFPDVQPGEVITLIGKDGDQEISAEDWAELLGTISWEILCGFKHRLPRLSLN